MRRLASLAVAERCVNRGRQEGHDNAKVQLKALLDLKWTALCPYKGKHRGVEQGVISQHSKVASYLVT